MKSDKPTLKQVFDADEKWSMLDEMIRRNPCSLFTTREQINLLDKWVVNAPVSFCVIETPLTKSDRELWLSNHGEWSHQAGSTVAHNELGEAYFGWMLKRGYAMNIGDSPDFEARTLCGRHSIHGDIGRVGFPGFFNAFERVREGDIWVSVMDWKTQFVLEFNYWPHLIMVNNNPLDDIMREWVASIIEPVDYNKYEQMSMWGG